MSTYYQEKEGVWSKIKQWFRRKPKRVKRTSVPASKVPAELKKMPSSNGKTLEKRAKV
jgi:hypothetical protein